jgi:hypothetical protein
MDAMIAYLEAHPLVAVVLVVLVVLLFGSLIKKLVKLALIVGLLLLIALYLTDQEASKDWRTQGELLLKKAEEKADQYGQKALEKSKEVLKKQIAE